MMHMYLFRFCTLSAFFLLVISSALFATGNERPSIDSHPQLAESLVAPGYSQEVPLWPEGSKVLQDGIRELAKEKGAITHPSFLIYSPKIHSTRSAILVFPGGAFVVSSFTLGASAPYLRR
ncbi:MAG: hypothetical protein ACREPB_06815 [Arenimonas sp.]